MRLVDLLVPERILIPLRGKGLNEAAGKLTTAIIKTTEVSDPQALRQIVRSPDERNFVATGQTFILHIRTPVVEDLVVALGVAEQPIRREKGSEQEARIVLLLVAPPSESSARLRAGSAFSLVLSRQEILDVLLRAKTPTEIVDAAPLADIEVPAYLTVRDVMDPRRRIVLRPDTLLGEASRLMALHRVPQLPVVSDANEVLGAVTHRELLRNLLPLYVKRLNNAEFRAAPRPNDPRTDPHDIPVRDVMDRTVLCVSEDQTLAEVATMMVNRNVDRFPVVKDGALVGLLTRGDIVRRLLGP
ncbi:MAG: CBS domain-containing protein [Gemmatimonadales bacterium]